MRWGRCVVAAVAALALSGAVVLDGGVAGAAPKPSGPAFQKTDPCTWLRLSDVQRTFGGPLTTSRNTGLAVACDYIVGPPLQPIGTLRVTLIFPFFSQPGETGIDALEVDRAIDGANGVAIASVRLGKASYLNLDSSMLNVAVSKKFTFALQWTPGAAGSGGGKITPPVQAKLLAVAKVVVARTPSKLR